MADNSSQQLAPPHGQVPRTLFGKIGLDVSMMIEGAASSEEEWDEISTPCPSPRPRKKQKVSSSELEELDPRYQQSHEDGAGNPRVGRFVDVEQGTQLAKKDLHKQTRKAKGGIANRASSHTDLDASDHSTDGDTSGGGRMIYPIYNTRIDEHGNPAEAGLHVVTGWGPIPDDEADEPAPIHGCHGDSAPLPSVPPHRLAEPKYEYTGATHWPTRKRKRPSSWIRDCLLDQRASSKPMEYGLPVPEEYYRARYGSPDSEPTSKVVASRSKRNKVGLALHSRPAPPAPPAQPTTTPSPLPVLRPADDTPLESDTGFGSEAAHNHQTAILPAELVLYVEEWLASTTASTHQILNATNATAAPSNAAEGRTEPSDAKPTPHEPSPSTAARAAAATVQRDRFGTTAAQFPSIPTPSGKDSRLQDENAPLSDPDTDVEASLEDTAQPSLPVPRRRSLRQQKLKSSKGSSVANDSKVTKTQKKRRSTRNGGYGS